ncbi:hypothetical protein [Solidesulfovibrio alcoholivorans]|uniref:hypothetical protein n=1 Tax=Solidesulfovibrio alcoholivorans TaxID=81406 RepID=UPI0012EB4488|nr:hypothetical protein [Solidesulfovibrio alcoholivorans]
MLFASMFLDGCSSLEIAKPEPPDAPPLTRVCPRLSDIAAHIEKREYVELSEGLRGCVNDEQIRTTYNNAFTDGYKYKFFVEALAAYASYQDFQTVLNLRDRLPFLSPEAKHLFDDYVILAGDRDSFALFKEVMQCVLTLPDTAQPSACLARYDDAIRQSQVVAVYQRAFGDGGSDFQTTPGRVSRNHLQ